RASGGRENGRGTAESMPNLLRPGPPGQAGSIAPAWPPLAGGRTAGDSPRGAACTGVPPAPPPSVRAPVAHPPAPRAPRDGPFRVNSQVVILPVAPLPAGLSRWVPSRPSEPDGGAGLTRRETRATPGRVGKSLAVTRPSCLTICLPRGE